MNFGTLRQILILTDGCSNMGENPIQISQKAAEAGITVNVIGIVEHDHLETTAVREIEEIAKAGNGISQITYTKQLSQTVQMVTRKAMTQTLHGLMNKELRQILGSKKSLEDLTPSQRMEVVEIVDEYSEKSSFEVVVLVDVSGSMQDKLQMVKESLLDLSISLNSRIGENMYSLYVFPGVKNDVDCLIDWNPKFNQVSSIFSKLQTGGMTPTGPAIRKALEAFEERNLSIRGYLNDEQQYYDEQNF